MLIPLVFKLLLGWQVHDAIDMFAASRNLNPSDGPRMEFQLSSFQDLRFNFQPAAPVGKAEYQTEDMLQDVVSSAEKRAESKLWKLSI